jgi:hypothetical protein
MSNNYPDDCQGNGIHLPWNQSEQEIYVCWHCGDEVEEDSLQEVKTECSGYQFISECCIEDYIK